MPLPKRGRTAQRDVGRLKADVLGKLAQYEVYAKRLKKADPSAYKQYRRLGAWIIPESMLSDATNLEPVFYNVMPSFGAAAIGIGITADSDKTEQEDVVPMRFVWFTKLDRPGRGVERPNRGTVYSFKVYFDDTQDKKINNFGHGLPLEWMVAVAPDGMIRALRVLKSETQRIRHRRGIDRKYPSIVHHQRWGLPDIDLKDGESKARTIEICARVCLNFWAQAAHQSMIRVTATAKDVVMPFVVDVIDTPAFFSDRETTLTVKGTKQRIFHVVRSHRRRLSDGRVIGVKLQFRGLRDFSWNGYSVSITVPGRDHLDIADVRIGTIDSDVAEAEGVETVELDAGADMLADIIGAPR
jgi:hypothetical protein